YPNLDIPLSIPMDLPPEYRYQVHCNLVDIEFERPPRSPSSHHPRAGQEIVRPTSSAGRLFWFIGHLAPGCPSLSVTGVEFLSSEVYNIICLKPYIIEEDS
ncbi:unnamed protein product, partial [Gordionus sp. m RMFG-2023]